MKTTFVELKIKYYSKQEPNQELHEGAILVRPELILAYSNDIKTVWIQGMGSFNYAEGFTIDPDKMQLNTPLSEFVDIAKKQMDESSPSGGLF